MPSITIYSKADWAQACAGHLQASTEPVLASRGAARVMLTGGRGAGQVYQAWRALPAFGALRGVTFLLGDERAVPDDHPESNARLVREQLFPNGVPTGCRFVPLAAPDGTLLSAPAIDQEPIDLLLLSVGEDGHVASLFPHGEALDAREAGVVAVTGPKPPTRRYTITPRVVREAGAVVVLASGPEKAAVLAKALQNPDNIADLPVRLTLRGTWLLDTPLPPTPA